jgi:hypothetical protein
MGPQGRCHKDGNHENGATANTAEINMARFHRGFSFA